MPTITQREYKNIILRQEKTEKKLELLKNIMKNKIGEEHFRSLFLKFKEINIAKKASPVGRREVKQGKVRLVSDLKELMK